MSEASYMAECQMGELAEEEMRRIDREQSIRRMEERRREKQKENSALKNARIQMVKDLLTLGVLTGSVDEHIQKLEKSSLAEQQVKNTSSAKVGEKTTCPNCGRGFVKKSYNQVFCSNQKKKYKGRDCKSEYHNAMEGKVRPF